MKRFELDLTDCELPSWGLPRIIPLRVGTHGADFDVDDPEINSANPMPRQVWSRNIPVGAVILRLPDDGR